MLGNAGRSISPSCPLEICRLPPWIRSVLRSCSPFDVIHVDTRLISIEFRNFLIPWNLLALRGEPIQWKQVRQCTSSIFGNLASWSPWDRRRTCRMIHIHNLKVLSAKGLSWKSLWGLLLQRPISQHNLECLPHDQLFPQESQNSPSISPSFPQQAKYDYLWQWLLHSWPHEQSKVEPNQVYSYSSTCTDTYLPLWSGATWNQISWQVHVQVSSYC